MAKKTHGHLLHTAVIPASLNALDNWICNPHISKDNEGEADRSVTVSSNR